MPRCPRRLCEEWQRLPMNMWKLRCLGQRLTCSRNGEGLEGQGGRLKRGEVDFHAGMIDIDADNLAMVVKIQNHTRRHFRGSRAGILGQFYIE